jgi:hypothetical protein
MFRRTVGLNVEACDDFLDQVLHKRDAKMLCAFGSQSALGGSRIHRASTAARPFYGILSLRFEPSRLRIPLKVIVKRGGL